MLLTEVIQYEQFGNVQKRAGTLALRISRESNQLSLWVSENAARASGINQLRIHIFTLYRCLYRFLCRAGACMTSCNALHLWTQERTLWFWLDLSSQIAIIKCKPLNCWNSAESLHIYSRISIVVPCPHLLLLLQHKTRPNFLLFLVCTYRKQIILIFSNQVPYCHAAHAGLHLRMWTTKYGYQILVIIWHSHAEQGLS